MRSCKTGKPTYIRTHIHLRIRTYLYTYIHTHTHTEVEQRSQTTLKQNFWRGSANFWLPHKYMYVCIYVCMWKICKFFVVHLKHIKRLCIVHAKTVNVCTCMCIVQAYFVEFCVCTPTLQMMDGVSMQKFQTDTWLEFLHADPIHHHCIKKMGHRTPGFEHPGVGIREP